MILTKLGFDTSIDGNANYFIEKIWKGLTGLSGHMASEYLRYQQRYLEKFDVLWEGDDYTEFLSAKLHTIRKKDEVVFKKDQDLYLVIHKNSALEFQFTPTLKCILVQHIKIEETKTGAIHIWVDNRLLNDKESHQLAINDGFLDQSALSRYFGGYFQGSLIHWTALSY